MIDTQKLREALDQIEGALLDAYHNAGQECCGHGYGECCGNPEPVWDAADQKIMDVLGPIQRMLSDAVSQADAQAAEIARLREAAEILADWAEHEVGAEPDLTPGLAEVRAALAQEGS